jgi:hypothetical protein
MIALREGVARRNGSRLTQQQAPQPLSHCAAMIAFRHVR